MKTIMIAAVGFGYATANLHNVLARNVSYTTEVVTAYTTFCPAPTTLLVNSKTFTVTEATTLTITDCPCTIVKPHQPTRTPSPNQPDECASKCWAQFQSCHRTVPAPPQAGCGLDLDRCLGYDWYQGGRNLNNAPTACQKTGTPSTPSTPSGSKPTMVEPSPSPTAPQTSGQPEECAAKCWSHFQSCYRTVPAPPQAGCGLDLNRCLGYDWYQGGKNLNNAPSACQKGGSPSTLSAAGPTGVVPSPSATVPPASGQPQASGQPDECATKCWAQFQSCYRTVPAPPQAGCGLDLNRCLGYDWYQGGKNLNNTPSACQKSESPGTPSGTKPSVPEVSPSGTPPNGSQPPTVAGASSLQPLGVIVVAAMAMLL